MQTIITELEQKLDEVKTFKPLFGIILGSGLGDLPKHLDILRRIPYGELPGFPLPSIKGHEGVLYLAKSASVRLLVFSGRFHYYEGYDLATTTLPIRVMQLSGVKGMIVTNAAGGIGPGLIAGDLMLITDHLNLIGSNPLRGENNLAIGPRFPDMSDAYHLEYRMRASMVATALKIPLKQGVYAALSGPSYETPAEIRMLRTLGADAVGMSTVPEVIAANHAGIKVLGISCISNLAAGLSDKPLDHNEVIEVTERIKTRFTKFVLTCIPKLAECHGSITD